MDNICIFIIKQPVMLTTRIKPKILSILLHLQMFSYHFSEVLCLSLLQASLGTTKYCSYFLKSMQCPKPDCMYLHELGDEAASFTKEEMQVKLLLFLKH